MVEMTGLQKLIVTFFILTIVLTCISLGMFFIDTPFKSVQKCVDNNTAVNDYDLHNSLQRDGKIRDCTWTASKDLSPVHDAIINATAVCGGIFVVLSAYAYISRKKEDVPQEK